MTQKKGLNHHKQQKEIAFKTAYLFNLPKKKQQFFKRNGD